MSIKQITLPNVANFHKVGFYPLIAKYKAGTITESMLPIPVCLIDETTKTAHDFKLMSVVNFNTGLPEIISYMTRNKSSIDLEPELLAEFQVKQINNLAFYLYVKF